MPIKQPFLKERVTAPSIACRSTSRVQSTWVTKLRTYIAIPAFSIEAVWRGASEIVAKFNFTIDNAVSIIHITENSDYCACISWKPTSDTIVRYKLWNNVGEILYVPLYSGERIGTTFTIEIWNVKPEGEAQGGGELILEGGDVEGMALELEGIHADEVLVLDGVETLIGTNQTISNDGEAILKTSLMIIPTDFCSSSMQSLGTADLCYDITIDLDGWNPSNGDYFLVDGNCGETILITGPTFEGTELVLQSTDGTWHAIFTSRIDGFTYLSVDQEESPASDTPYVVMSLSPTIKHKVSIHDSGEGFYFISVDQETTDEDLDYYVLYLQAAEDSLYYGVRLLEENDNVFINPNQEDTVL